MSPPSSRLVELDFFRGLVLLVILVDHIGGSMLSRATLHRYALCDAAEVFVFLGGFATATAYLSLAARRNGAAARQRFVRRAFEIYRAFLVTAALMLLVSGLLPVLGFEGPNLAQTDLDAALAAPLATLFDIVSFQRQPYLSTVLPMYALFALAVPAMLPLAQRRPRLLLAGSVALWALAPPLSGWLPAAEGAQWSFNPFAWQLLFVLGVLVRVQPFHARVGNRRYEAGVTVLAAAIVAAVAVYKLFFEQTLPPGHLKQNLDWTRMANFLALAWLALLMIRRGWVKKLAHRLPLIGEIGRQGLLCFIAGAVISLVADSILYTLTDGYLDVALGLAADAAAIGALLAVAKLARMGTLSRRPASATRIPSPGEAVR